MKKIVNTDKEHYMKRAYKEEVVPCEEVVQCKPPVVYIKKKYEVVEEDDTICNPPPILYKKNGATFFVYKEEPKCEQGSDSECSCSSSSSSSSSCCESSSDSDSSCDPEFKYVPRFHKESCGKYIVCEPELKRMITNIVDQQITNFEVRDCTGETTTTNKHITLTLPQNATSYTDEIDVTDCINYDSDVEITTFTATMVGTGTVTTSWYNDKFNLIVTFSDTSDKTIQFTITDSEGHSSTGTVYLKIQ